MQNTAYEMRFSDWSSDVCSSDLAVLVAGNGAYSFKGSGYVRGGIFDRIEVIQQESSFRFRDRNHQRLADVAAAGAPSFAEVALFVVPEDAALDPTAPWRQIGRAHV